MATVFVPKMEGLGTRWMVQMGWDFGSDEIVQVSITLSSFFSDVFS